MKHIVEVSVGVGFVNYRGDFSEARHKCVKSDNTKK